MAEKLLMLALSPTMETGTIAKWNKAEGDPFASGDVLCEVETDKTTMDYESVSDATLLKVLVPEGGTVKVGEPIAIAGRKDEDISSLLAGGPSVQAPLPAEEKAPTPHPSSPKPSPNSVDAARAPDGVLASPLARRIAQQKGLDIQSVRGSGPGGRVVKRDVERATARPPLVRGETAGADDEVIAVSEKRRVIAQRLTGSFQFTPHYYLKVAVNAESVLEERARVNKSAKEKVSLNAFIVKFVAEALKRHPQVNASWNENTLVRHRRADIALAVAQPDGLITPIVRDCGAKGILEIDRELKALIEKARTNTLAVEEYSGSTFTISNLGMFGIREFTAIINPPEAAILAVGEIARQAIVEDSGEVAAKPVMMLTLSCDHRVLDGAVSAAFMQTLKGIFEDPINLVL